MNLTNTQRALLDEDTQALIEAGFLTSDLKITEALHYYLEHLAFIDKKAQVVSRAKEKIAEKKAQEKA